MGHNAGQTFQGIRKLQHFVFSEEMGGKLIVKHTCDGEEKTSKGNYCSESKSHSSLVFHATTWDRQALSNRWPEYKSIYYMPSPSVNN